MKNNNDLYAYAVGFVSMSVCVPKGMTKEEIECEANFQHPTGISSRWKISEHKHFADGSPIPRVCEDDPDRLHYLLNC
jgi:hypothetical protein